jgi:hypothetical protein
MNVSFYLTNLTTDSEGRVQQFEHTKRQELTSLKSGESSYSINWLPFV